MTAGAATAIWERGGLDRALGGMAPAAVVESVDIDWDLDKMSARELRALPGIGRKRAVDVVRARWEHDPAHGEFELESVDGIGPKTAMAARGFVQEQGSGVSKIQGHRIGRVVPVERPSPPPARRRGL